MEGSAKSLKAFMYASSYRGVRLSDYGKDLLALTLDLICVDG